MFFAGLPWRGGVTPQTVTEGLTHLPFHLDDLGLALIPGCATRVGWHGGASGSSWVFSL